MSGIDQRCIQFYEGAVGISKSKGILKEISTLRKFLFKNQEQRFTDKAVSRLFDTIQVYCAKENTEIDTHENREKLRKAQEDLLEDALKMPFNVFSTKYKQKMMKRLEEMRRPKDENGFKDPEEQKLTFSVIEIDNDIMTLMEINTGDTIENVPLSRNVFGSRIKTLFEKGDAVDVKAKMTHSSKEPEIISIIEN